MSKFIRMLFLGFALFAAAAAVEAGRQVAAGKPQPEDAQLKDRVKLFYQDLLKGDRLAALELVSPESKNQFLKNRFAGLTDYQVVGIEVDQSGEKATARVIRVTRIPNVGQPLDLEVIDTWQRSNGQWYLVLPPPGEVDTPFGKMKLGTDGTQSNAEANAMKQKIEQRYKNVDPDQYIRALQKVAIDPTTVRAKPDDKQQSQPAPTTTQNDKPRTQP